MRGGFGGGATPPTGGLGGRTPQKLGLRVNPLSMGYISREALLQNGE